MNTEANRKTEWVVGIGEALWDILPEGRKIGGAPANFAYHMSQFGLRSCAVSAVGDDEAGRELRNQLREKGVGHMLETVPFPTGTVEVTLDGAGIPSYEIRQGVAWDNIPFTPQIEELARHTRAACFGSLAQRSPISHRTIGRFLETMPDGEGQYKVFDINLRQHFYTQQVVEESLRKCNILKINDEELAVVGGMFGMEGMQPGEQCRTLLDRYGLRIVILTCGAAGSSVFAPTPGHISPRRGSKWPTRSAQGTRSRHRSWPPCSRGSASGKHTGWPWMSRPTSARSTAPCPGCRNGLPLGCAMTAPPYDRDDRDAPKRHPAPGRRFPIRHSCACRPTGN